MDNGKRKKKGPLRRVSDAQLRAALADPDNKNIIRSVLLKYAGLLHESDLAECGLLGTWRALGHHDPSFGKKFTTNLYWWVSNACNNAVRKQQHDRRRTVPLGEQGDIACRHKLSEEGHRDDLDHVRECMRLLSRSQRRLVEDYYLGGRTLEEIASLRGLSKETVRHRLDLAVRRLRELCEELAGPVYSVSA